MKKILIIEDDEILLSALEKKLQIEGYEALTANDGEVGLQKIKEEKPDLVLLDMILPRLNGLEIMKKLKDDGVIVPIIVISNSGQPVEIEMARKLGAIDWLVKVDFGPEEVIEKVKKHLLQ